jgi:RNA polymerase sigma-70 factor (ECF subfamily)
MPQLTPHLSALPVAGVLSPAPESTEPAARTMDEETLVRHLFRTDPAQACSWLFRRYHAPLCNHALRFVYSREVAEDIVGEVFCNFWIDRGYEQVTTSYRAYLFRAVRYRSLTYLRWELSRQGDSLSETDPAHRAAPFDFSAEADSPAAALQFDELYAAINRAIADLPPQCRRVFLMSRFELKSYRDIADELGVSVKAVEAHVSKALGVLRRVLRDGFLLVFLLAGPWSG